MPGTFFGLEIGRRGLQTHQRALDVTGHNLANSSTNGYTRQEAVFDRTDPYTTPDLNSSVTPGQLGTGVMTSMIDRIRDQYLDPQVRDANTDRHYWEDQINTFKKLEACFAEPAASGIADRMVDFFKGWQELNNNPQDPGVKAVVMEYGVQLASLMSYTYNQMGSLQETVVTPGAFPYVEGGEIKDQVDRVNALLTQIQSYTNDIVKIYRVGQQPNDLLDKRDLLLDELAQYGPLDVQYITQNGTPTGEISLTFMADPGVPGSGVYINTSTDPWIDREFSLDLTGVGPDYSVELSETNSGVVCDLTAEKDNTAIGGSLLGLEKARQSIIEFKDTLNEIAVNLRDKINSKNNTPPAATVVDFFIGSLATGDFAVNNNIINNPSVIDGTKAGLIADIRQEDMDASRSYTLEDCYGMLTADVGSKAKGTDDMAASQQAIQEQMFNLRESVSGVSVDEELTKMVQYQYGYQGSARVVSMMDDLLDYLINRMKNF